MQNIPTPTTRKEPAMTTNDHHTFTLSYVATAHVNGVELDEIPAHLHQHIQMSAVLGFEFGTIHDGEEPNQVIVDWGLV